MTLATRLSHQPRITSHGSGRDDVSLYPHGVAEFRFVQDFDSLRREAVQTVFAAPIRRFPCRFPFRVLGEPLAISTFRLWCIRVCDLPAVTKQLDAASWIRSVL